MAGPRRPPRARARVNAAAFRPGRPRETRCDVCRLQTGSPFPRRGLLAPGPRTLPGDRPDAATTPLLGARRFPGELGRVEVLPGVRLYIREMRFCARPHPDRREGLRRRPAFLRAPSFTSFWPPYPALFYSFLKRSYFRSIYIYFVR